jgi:hypothetical protein
MLDPRLVADIVARVENPVSRPLDTEAYAFAVMTAESLKLEGIETTPEQVLDSVRNPHPVTTLV